MARVLVLVAALLFTASPVSAEKIGNDNGGMIVTYALRVARATGTVEFHGRCASACTLYLGLHPKQLCLGKRASFQFHAPYGQSARANETARQYMWNTYPQWVRAWISARGGLTAKLITMPRSYAAKFLKSC
jgi:hypothetical protein